METLMEEYFYLIILGYALVLIVLVLRLLSVGKRKCKRKGKKGGKEAFYKQYAYVGLPDCYF